MVKTGQIVSVDKKYYPKFCPLEGIPNYYIFSIIMLLLYNYYIIYYIIKETCSNGPYPKLMGINNSLFDSCTTRIFFFQSFLKSVPGIPLFNSSRPNLGRREKIKLNFYFHTSLWCLKRFYESFKGLRKTFWGTTKKWK